MKDFQAQGEASIVQTPKKTFITLQNMEFLIFFSFLFYHFSFMELKPIWIRNTGKG